MKRLAQLTIVTLAGMLPACSTMMHSPDKAQAEQHWNEVRGRVKHQLAEQHYQAGLFDDAIETAMQSLALDPTQVAPYVLLARAYLETGKRASAQQVLESARRAGLQSADLTYTEGVLLEQRDRFDAALEKYTLARLLQPTNVDYLVAEAECLVAADRAVEALALLDQHAHRVDEDSSVAVLAAHIATLIGNTADAAHRYRHAIAPEGEADLMAEELGLLLTRARRWHEALTVLEPLLDGADDMPVSAAVRRALATCYLAIGEADAASRTLGEYARGHPADALAQLLLAKAALANGDWVTARRAIDLVERCRPDHPEVKLVRAVMQWKRGDLPAAAASLHRVLADTPDDVEAHCLMAEVLLAQHNKKAAQTHLERALQISPRCTWASEALKSLG